jgi:hypothetical protein
VQRVTAAVGQANGGQATVTGSDPTASCAPDACSVDIGTNVIYTAAPGAGFRFNAWSGSCAGGGPTVNLTGLTQDVSCTPSFKAAVAVRWNVTGSQGGSVTGAVVSGTGSCGASSCLVDKGSSVSLTRSAAHAGWRFQNWTGDCAVAGSGTGLTFPSLSADRNCGAVFIQQFTVAYSKNDTQNDPANTVSAGLSGGVGSCQNNVCTVDKGSTVTITATAGGANSVFNGWTGSCAGMANPAQLANVSGNKTCVAQFVHS